MSTDWVDAALAAAGLARTSELQLVRERPWASVHRLETTGGAAWFKITAPSTRFEAALYGILPIVDPQHVVVPIAVDTERGWILLPDAGPSFHDQFPDDLGGALADGLAAYGELQRRASGRLDIAGLADMTPAAMPQRFDEAVAAASKFAAADPEELAAVRALRPRVESWCRELAADQFPPSIDHNDLHAHNVVGTRAAPRFYDWGDAVLAHPFACLLTPLDTVPTPVGDMVRDAYLAGFGDPVQLLPVARLALKVARVARAWIWARALEGTDAPPEWADAPWEHLRQLL